MGSNPRQKFNKKLLASSIASLVVGLGHSSGAFAQDPIQEEVIVRGIKSSLNRSLDIKRESTQLVEAITADDIGKMPDQNVAESLQRLPGIQIDRVAGEGTKVRIRGLEQNTTLLNNNTFVSGLEFYQLGEGNTEYSGSLEGVPSELLGGVEVYKSPRASLVEGGIGGTINLKTRNAFDLREPLIAGNVKFDRGEDAGKISPSAALVLGHNWDDKIAAILSLTATNRTVHSDQAQQFNRGAWQVSETSDGTEYIRPGMLYFTDGETDRERLGGSLSVQWAATDAVEVQFDWFRSELTLDTRQYSVKFDSGAGSAPGIDESKFYDLDMHSVVDGGDRRSIGVIRDASYATAYAENNTMRQITDVTTDNFSLGTKFDNDGRFRASANVAYAESQMDSESALSDGHFAPYGVRAFTGEGPTGWGTVVPNDPTPDYDSDNLRTWGYTSENGFASGRYSNPEWLTNEEYLMFKSHWAFANHVTNETMSFRADGEYDMEMGVWTILRAGFRVAQQEVDFQEGRYQTDLSQNGAPSIRSLDPTADPGFDPARGGHQPGVAATVGWDPFGDAAAGMDVRESYLWGPYGYFLDPAIGDKSFDEEGLFFRLTGIDAPDAGRFGGSPGVMPWMTYAENPNRYVRLDNFFPSANFGVQGILFDDAERMDNPRDWIDSIAPEAPVAFFLEPLESWKVKESTNAAYVESDFEGDNWTVNAGVRVVQTTVEVTYAETTAESRLWATDSWNGSIRDFDLQTREKDYTDVLPSLNFVYDVAEGHKIRASAAKVISRANLQDLGKGFSKNFNRSASGNYFEFISGTAGNPDLEPYRADQADLAYEYYFSDLGLASVGVFYKDVEAFIAQRTQNELHTDESPEGATVGAVTRPFNGDGGSVQGVEVSYQMGFENGLGFSANYTYSDTETDQRSLTRDNLPLTGVSKHAYNLIGFFENDVISARIAYTWRDEYRDPQRATFGVAGISEDMTAWINDYGQWDASLTWNLTDTLAVTAEAINLTGEAQSSFLEFEEQFMTYDSSEPRFVVGMNFRF